MDRNVVVSEHGPKAIGPYAHAVWTDQLLFVSGQTPIDPKTQKLVEADITIQTQRVFDNLEAVLKDAGLGMDDVIKCNVYITSMKHFPALNSVYQTRFKPPYPARTTVAVMELPLGALVEIEMIAQKHQNP
jgi:2-iminobutanoate/2-iminopropanoate deaminase